MTISPLDSFLTFSDQGKTNSLFELAGAGTKVWNFNVTFSALAEKENKSDLIAGVDLSTNSKEVTDILIDLAQRESMNESSRFASVLVDKMSGVGPLLPNSHRFAGFAVLKAPDVPSVLVELGFLSNERDARALLSGTHRTKVAEALYRAVDEYFNPMEQMGGN